MQFFATLAILAASALASPSSSPGTELQARDLIQELTHLITDVNIFITADTLTTNQISLNIDVHNPLIIPLKVNSIKSTATVNGTTVSSFTHSFDNFVTPPFGSSNSGNITGVTLTQGAVNSLQFISVPFLNVSAILNIDAAFIPIPFFPYSQKDVPTNYNIDLLG